MTGNDGTATRPARASGHPPDLAEKLLYTFPPLTGFVVAASIYGALHGCLVGVICPQMFTHVLPDIFGPMDPRALGVLFGVGNSWWVGLLVGIPIVLAARLGSRAPVPTLSLMRGLVVVLLVTGIASLGVGGLTWLLTGAGFKPLRPFLEREVPPEAHETFLTAAASVNTAFFVSAIGSLVLLLLTIVRRRRNDASIPAETF